MTRPAELPVLRLVASLFFFVATSAHAQHFTFQHYEQEQGLKNHDVFKLIQDKTGLLWSATENGLFRYDGADFHRFGAADGIPESMLIDVYQDASGRIWAAGADHLYYLAGEHFQTLPTPTPPCNSGPANASPPSIPGTSSSSIAPP